MIRGKVFGDEARISLNLRGTSRKKFHEVNAVIDTGFTGTLCLPNATISKLGLRWEGIERGALADGSECLLDVFLAQVVWDGRERRILVYESDSEPLIGMSLLYGYELRVQVRDRGDVTIKWLRGKLS